MTGPLHVLVVDPSAVAREVATRRLAGRRFRVSTAPDAGVAAARVRLAHPDLLLVALPAPADAALRLAAQVTEAQRTAILVVDRGGGDEAVMAALALGAAGVLPDALLHPNAPEPQATRELVRRALDAVRGRDGRHRRGAAPAGAAATSRVGDESLLIAIGASTGGTAAVTEVLSALPADAPPVVIVIHMPAEFTGAFARHLDARSRVGVQEAQAGDRLERGRAYVAPGDRHMEVYRRGQDLVLALHAGPLVSGHRPSVDVLLHSVARACGARAVGVVLTGMGRDGAEGLLAVHAAGGATIVQDEATSVVFGMGREAIRLGAADRVLPLPRIGGALLQRR